MKKLILILIIAAIIFIAGCQRGITGQAVRDVDSQPIAAEETTSSIYFAYQENQKECKDGVIRKQILPNGTVKEYCNRNLIPREKCDVDASCGRDAECVAGYCRPI